MLKRRVTSTLLVLTLLLAGLIVLRPYFRPDAKVSAQDSIRFDFIHVLSPASIYKGNQGILLLDKRNGNVWFIGKGQGAGVPLDPVFVVRLPLEKLDQTPSPP